MPIISVLGGHLGFYFHFEADLADFGFIADGLRRYD